LNYIENNSKRNPDEVEHRLEKEKNLDGGRFFGNGSVTFYQEPEEFFHE